jgi:hypothetical protein
MPTTLSNEKSSPFSLNDVLVDNWTYLLLHSGMDVSVAMKTMINNQRCRTNEFAMNGNTP